MIGSLVNKVLKGGNRITNNWIVIVVITLVVSIIDLLIRGYIIEYGYNNLINKLRLNLPKIDLLDSLMIVIIALCLFRN